MKDAGLLAAIAAAGSGRELGRRLGLSGGAIAQWSQVPADRVAEVEAVTSVPRTLLRPDLFSTQRGFAESQTPSAEARALGLDPDAIAAQAIRDAIRAEKERRWLVENKDAIDAWNDWVEHNELPLARYRMF